MYMSMIAVNFGFGIRISLLDLSLLRLCLQPGVAALGSLVGDMYCFFAGISLHGRLVFKVVSKMFTFQYIWWTSFWQILHCHNNRFARHNRMIEILCRRANAVFRVFNLKVMLCIPIFILSLYN